MTDDEKKLIVMIGFKHKTDARMIYQQDPHRRIFASYKFYESAKNNFLKYVGVLGELDTKKKQLVLT